MRIVTQNMAADEAKGGKGAIVALTVERASSQTLGAKTVAVTSLHRAGETARSGRQVRPHLATKAPWVDLVSTKEPGGYEPSRSSVGHTSPDPTTTVRPGRAGTGAHPRRYLATVTPNDKTSTSSPPAAATLNTRGVKIEIHSTFGATLISETSCALAFDWILVASCSSARSLSRKARCGCHVAIPAGYDDDKPRLYR